jgi:anti-anti-sigma regulatory factor
MLNATVATLSALSLCGALASGIMLLLGTQQALWSTLGSAAVLLLCALAYWVGRRGQMALACAIPALSVCAAVTGALALGAWESVTPAGYVLGVVIATLLSGWQGGLIVLLISLVSYGAVGWLYLAAGSPDVFLMPAVFTNLATLGLILAVVLILVHLFDRHFRALGAQRLEENRQYADEMAEATRERRELLAQLQAATRQQDEIAQILHQITTPVLPLSKGLIVMPLAGQLSPQRAERLLDDVLGGIKVHEADHVLLDVTGLLDIDAQSLSGLLKAIRGARLVGSQCALIGVQPGVAQELVSLGLDLSAILTFSTLREGVAEIGGRAPVSR